MARTGVFSLKFLLFFFVLFILIFLGETKQPAVDVVGAGGVMAVVLYAKYYLKKQRELSRVQTVVWAGLLLYLVLRSVFSDDIGYSVYTTIRHVEAFLVYWTFFCFFDQKDIRQFVHYLLGFCVISLTTAVVLTYSTFLQYLIPRMNLLYPAYGHNHVVDILLFGFPTAVILATHTQKIQYKILATVLLLGIVFSMSRAAMVITGLFIISSLGVYVVTKKFNRTHLLLVAALGFVAVSTIAAFYIVENNLLPHAGLELRKSSVFIDSRYGYYQQAITAISQKPLFGWGPGTFSLESLRFQATPLTYSWFAHNYYLEQLVELGSVGCVLLAFVFGTSLYYVLRAVKDKRKNVYVVSLAAATGLSLLYGFIDISLNFLVVWLLCFACMGIVLSS
jgi:O-antigen ligase